MATTYDRIYAVVRRVPRGRVATYGQVAAVAGLAGQARLVGYALHALPPGTTVPWHRVVNAEGRISLGRRQAGGTIIQRLRLESEGITSGLTGRISLPDFRWRPRLSASGHSTVPGKGHRRYRPRDRCSR